MSRKGSEIKSLSIIITSSLNKSKVREASAEAKKKTKLTNHNIMLMRTSESGTRIRSASVWNNELLITLPNPLHNTSNVMLCTTAKHSLARRLGAWRII